ncbi:MAG: thiol:disulfide interchange protein DsbC [Gammaproteobacteria bacterium]|jgi:thiol:disulfide interchange protein DsbC
MTYKFITTLLLSLSLLMGMSKASAQETSVDQTQLEEMTRLLKIRIGSDDIETPVETRLKGVYQTRFGGKFAYLVDGGRYVFIGEMFDLEAAENMTEVSRQKMVVDELANFGDEKLIIFPAQDEQLAVLNVFTDTSCSYCQKLHTEIKYLQEAGISVRYFPYPRGSNRGPGYQAMQKVWCSDDKPGALSIAKRTKPGSLGDGNCAAASYVDDGFELGERLGVTGTPALFTAAGVKFNGYVPYQQLIPQLLGN